jgi:Trk-type K+ transport system membrane component
MNSKKCNGCETKPHHSFEWEMIKELSLEKKRLFALLLVVLFLWFATIGGFVWHISKNNYSHTYTLNENGAINYEEIR